MNEHCVYEKIPLHSFCLSSFFTLFSFFFSLFDLCLPRPGGQLWWIVVQYNVILSIPPFFHSTLLQSFLGFLSYSSTFSLLLSVHGS